MRRLALNTYIKYQANDLKAWQAGKIAVSNNFESSSRNGVSVPILLYVVPRKTL